MSTPTDPTAGEGLSEAVQAGLRKCRVEDGAPVGLFREDDLFHISHMVTAEIERIVAARESAAATRARAEALREAADRVREFRDWYPLSIFPSLDEALSDDYAPSSERIAASSYRHAYGEVVPRNLRAWAAEIESDALAPDTAGESA